MKANNITNFGYVILINERPSLSILLESHEILNDIIVDSDDGLYEMIGENEMYLVGITIIDDEHKIFSADDLTDENLSEMTYNITPLFLYETKTEGLIMQDMVELELMNLLFYDVLDNYIKERE
jgi:hypothetical protein